LQDAQGDYEQMLGDSAEKRARDSKALSHKTGAKADLQGDLESDKEQKDSTTKELRPKGMQSVGSTAHSF
jgi:hypothetical protein